MEFSHAGHSPCIHENAVIAQTAVICGNVTIGENTSVLYGATIIAEGGEIVIGKDCVILENAVLRSTARHSLHIGDHVLVGPCAHLAGCTVEDNVFIATGAAVFHGARLCRGSEVRINGVVHLKTTLPENATVPINWIALGTPAQLFPPDQHGAIDAVQRPLNFPAFVYGVERKPAPDSNLPEITDEMNRMLRTHADDTLLERQQKDDSATSDKPSGQ